MEISLIRHGKSQHTEMDRLTCAEFIDWMKKYDANGVYKKETYPKTTLKKISTAKVVITSDLERAIHSAKLLKPEKEIISDSIFREVEFPSLPSVFQNIKLNPTIWAIFLRLLWFSGYSKECESLMEAKVRAKKASQKLVDYATEHGALVLVGHGFFNRLIGKKLRRNGWRGKRRTGLTHWNCTTYFM